MTEAEFGELADGLTDLPVFDEDDDRADRSERAMREDARFDGTLDEADEADRARSLIALPEAYKPLHAVRYHGDDGSTGVAMYFARYRRVHTSRSRMMMTEELPAWDDLPDCPGPCTGWRDGYNCSDYDAPCRRRWDDEPRCHMCYDREISLRKATDES